MFRYQGGAALCPGLVCGWPCEPKITVCIAVLGRLFMVCFVTRAALRSALG